MNKEDILNIFNNGLFTEIYLEAEATTRAYEKHFQILASIMPIRPNEKILDVGAAYGSSSLALFRKMPNIEVMAMDPADKLLYVSKAKFNGENIGELLAQYSHNGAILTYLASQHQECLKFGKNISYIQGFAEDLDKVNIGKFNHVMGSLALHWLINPIKAFSNFNNILRADGTISISSSSWKYNISDPILNKERKFDDAPFVKKFYDNLNKQMGHQEKFVTQRDYIWDLEKTLDLLNKTGFQLVRYSEEKMPISLSHMLMSCKSGAYYRGRKLLESFGKSEIINIIKETLFKTISEVNILDPANNCYEISPYILAKKLS